MSYYEQDGLQRTGGIDGVGGGQFNTPGMGPIGEQQAAGVNHMDNICRGFLDLSGSVAFELSAFFAGGGKRRRA